MKKQIFCLILAFLGTNGLFSQTINVTDSLGRRQGLWIDLVPNMEIEQIERYYVDGVPNGPYRKYDTYSNRRRKTLIGEGTLVMGKWEGDYKEYCLRTGKVTTHYYFEHGIQQGYQYWYHCNGNLDTRMYCRNDILDGYIEDYDGKGVLQSKNAVKNGVRSDSIVFYNKKGLRVFVKMHKYHEDLRHIILDKDGRPVRIWNFTKCLPAEYLYGVFYGIEDKKNKRLIGWEFSPHFDASVSYKTRKKKAIKIYFDENGEIKNRKCECEYINPADTHTD